MGCSGSTPAGADPSHVKPEVGTADSFSKKATQQQQQPQRKASLVAVRREGYSSGKTTTGAPSASNEMISGTTIKTANDLDGLRKACSAIVLFSTMTTEQQEAIFAAMFEVCEELQQRYVQEEGLIAHTRVSSPLPQDAILTAWLVSCGAQARCS